MATTSSAPKVLFVISSHDQLGNTGKKTGFFLEELITPYYILFDKGVNITIASPKGGQPPICPMSETDHFDTDSRRRFYQDAALQQRLSQTLKLKDVKADDYDGVFYPGGHGPIWDLSIDPISIKLIETFAAQKKPVTALCHGPVVLVNVKNENGEPLVKDRAVTGFSNSEEEVIEMTKVVPYPLEDRLKGLGGRYSSAKDFEAHVVVDGLLVTGQNPNSSGPTTLAFLKLLQK